MKDCSAELEIANCQVVKEANCHGKGWLLRVKTILNYSLQPERNGGSWPYNHEELPTTVGFRRELSLR